MKKISLISAPSILVASAVVALGTWATPAWAFAPFTVKNIEIRGLEHIAPGTVYNYLPIHIGEEIDDQKAQEAIKGLYATGFFKDVSIARSGDTLLVIVQERPIISSIKLEGVKAFSKDEVNSTLKGLGLVDRRIFNRAVLDQVVQGLQEQYNGMGYYAAKIHTHVETLPRNRVAIRIDVNEGEQATIKQLNIVGNKAFSESKLRGLFSLGAPTALSFYTKNDRYSREKLMDGLEKLRSFYMDRGYLDFDVESSQVQVTPDRRYVFITVNIHEGPVYHIQSVQLTGNLIVPKAELEKLVEVKAGDLFSRSKITDTNSAIADKLGDLGYAFANVTPVPKVDEKTREVAMDFQVDPGRQVYIRRIEITGNDKSRDYVVRRQFRQLEGALYDGALVRRSKERLQQTGFYDKIDTKTIPVPGHPDQLDLDVSVHERPTGSFSIGVGYSNAQGILFNGSISQNNFMGTGNALSFSANVGGLGTSYNLSFTDPYFTPDGISLGFNLYRNDTNLANLAVAPYREIEYGGTATLGIPVLEYVYDYMSLGYSSTTIDLTSLSPLIYTNYVNTFGPTNNAITVGNDLVYDSRNSPIFPTKGVYGSLSLKASVPPASLRWYKAELRGDYYHPFTSWLSGKIGARYGFINGYGGKNVPFFNNFYLGGPTTLPGYQTYALGPQVAGYPVGGTREALVDANLYFPLPGLADNKNFRMSLFVASGWVYGVDPNGNNGAGSYSNSYFPSLGQMRTTAGIGFLWISPLGPLRLSIAAPLNKQPGDLTQPLQFTVGNNF